MYVTLNRFEMGISKGQYTPLNRLQTDMTTLPGQNMIITSGASGMRNTSANGILRSFGFFD